MKLSFKKHLISVASIRYMPWLLSGLVLLLGLIITAGSWLRVQQDDTKKLRVALESSADITANNILSRFNSFVGMMNGVKGFIDGSDTITTHEFENYIKALQLDVQNGVRGVALVKLVPNSEKNSHVAEVRKQGFTEYQIKPEGIRDSYAPITDIEPLDNDNLKALGFDTFTVPVAKYAMEQSRDSGEVKITSHITLVQDAGKKNVHAFVMYLPIYQKDAIVNTVTEKRAAIKGWVDVPFRVNDIMGGLRGEFDSDLDLEIHDGLQLSNASRLYHSDHTTYEERHAQGGLLTSRQLDFGGARWTLLVSTTPEFEARIISRHKPVLVALLGISLTLLLSFLTWVLVRERQSADIRYQKLFDQASDGVMILNSNQNFVAANSAALKLLGYNSQELLAMRLSDILTKNELPRLAPSISKIMADIPHLEEWIYVRKDGSEFIAEISCRKLEGNHFFVILRDLTERKKAEQRIKRLTQLYKALSETNQAIVRMGNESDLFSLVCRCAVDFGSMQMAWIGQLDEPSQLILPVAVYGSDIDYIDDLGISANKDLPQGQGPTGIAMRENRSVIINDFISDPITSCWHERAASFGLRSSATFPIQRNEKPFAVLCVYDAKIDAFDEESIRLLSEMSSDISFALDNFDRETQRQQLLQDLKNAYKRISHIIDVNPAIIYSLKAHPFEHGGFVVDFIGPNVQKLTGYSLEEWQIAEFWFNHIHPDDQPSVLKAQQHLLNEDSLHHQYRFMHADGRYLWIEDQLQLVRDSAGNPTEITGAWLDITERKVAEKTLAENESRMSTILENVSACIYLKDLEGRYLFANKQVLDLWGTTHEEVVGFGDEKFFDAKTTALIHETDRSVLLEGKTISREEINLVNFTGKTKTFWSVKLPLRHADGTIYALCGISTDITERLFAEQSLRINAQVFENSREGIVITDANNNILNVNKAFTDITGYTSVEAVGKNPSLVSSDSQSKAFYKEMWQQVSTEDYWQGEVINRRKNGELYPQWLSISTIKDLEGKITQYIGVFSDLSERKVAEDRILFLSNFDLLTNLPNRNLLRDRTMLALATAKRTNSSIALLFIDLDRFKIVNESLGPTIGDQLLKEMSERLLKNIHADDTLCRQGGDEFILLLPSTDTEGVAHVAKKILDIIAKPFDFDGQRVTLTASIGIAEFPQDGVNFDQLTQSADAALYRAKQAGRNNFQFFTKQMHEQANEVLQIESELRQALENSEFLLHYQPKVDAITSKVIGAEALIRWKHPHKGLVPPCRFIPIAEESGLINEIGEWVLHTAVQQVADWQLAGLAVVPVAVNLSVVQFRQDTLYETVCQALRISKLEPSMLELEMTEGIAMENSDRTISVLNQLHGLGVSLSIDDFGTGYSSLSYLKRFKIDTLKIDQSFVRDLGRDPEDAAIVTAIIAMAHSLGFRTIAEGVETQEQLNFLREKQCDEIQGDRKSVV